MDMLLDKNVLSLHGEESTMADILDEVIHMNANGYIVDSYVVHGNNEALQIEYIKL